MRSVYETFEVGPLIDLAQEGIGNGYTAVKVVFDFHGRTYPAGCVASL